MTDHGTVPRRPTPRLGRRHGPAGPTLSSLLLCCACAGAWAAAPAVTGRPREQITARLVEPAKGAEVTVAHVVRDGKPVGVPKGMAVEPATGTLRWLPTESQAGAYDVELLVRPAGSGEPTKITRRLVVERGPITTDQKKVGQRLRAWYKQGTAAGNTGDFYDNRDRGHSALKLQRHPQLDRIEYSDEMKQRRLDFGLQFRFIHPHVTFGNSSTASGDMTWGSNARRMMLSGRAMMALWRQYTGNHLYIYPEHRDHDPGRNGRGGHGDLFPANTPYVIISQGSSGSDQAFVQAVAFTLAAFRPEVKKTLVETNLLMPTIQKILRRSMADARKRTDYLTGRAHPTVFDGRKLDTLRMVELAHALEPNAIPPMVRLRVIEEDGAVEGTDYFDAGRPERLFDTPAAICRVMRSIKQSRRIVVSAAASHDVNRRPLTYRWVLLRGDRRRVTIRPQNAAGSVAEIRLSHHERRPSYPGSPIESTRVDVGAFAHNGVAYSAPAFVSFYYLDNEVRTYADDGRVLEIGYDYGDSTIGYDGTGFRVGDRRYDVTDWQAAFDLLRPGRSDLAAKLFVEQLSRPAVARLRQIDKEFRPILVSLGELRKASESAAARRSSVHATLSDVRKKTAEARRADDDETAAAGEAEIARLVIAAKEAYEAASAASLKYGQARLPVTKLLTKHEPRISCSPKQRIERAFNAIKSDPGFYVRHARQIDALYEASEDAARKRAFLAARSELIQMDILQADGQGGWRLTPLRGGGEPPEKRLTKYERSRVEWFNVAILANLLYPGLIHRPYRANFVNPILATPKKWRDVYHYDSEKRMLGWTRYHVGQKRRFTAEGAMVEKADKLGRPVEARHVKYVIDRDAKGKPRELRYQPVGDPLRYEYASETDRIGRLRKDD